MRLGEWDWVIAELEARRAIETDPIAAMVVVSDLALFAALRGEPVDGLMRELEELTRGEPETSLRTTGLHWARAFVAMAGDDPVESRRQFHKGAAAFPQGAPEALLLAAREAILARDAGGAASELPAVDESRRRGRVIDNDRLAITAGVAALEGRTDDALRGYREVLRTWRELGAVWDEALAATAMAVTLDPSLPDVRDAATAAREIFVRLRAEPMLRILDQALERKTTTARAAVAVESAAAG
jgi:hypothetical protein